MPVSQSYEDEMLDQPWFPVEPNDVFPEEFRTYLRSPGRRRGVRRGAPRDLYRGVLAGDEDRHQGGERPDFFPYPQQYRFPED